MTLPLLLVPGLMCDHAVWSPLVPHVQPGTDCHVIDHGPASCLVQMAQNLLDQAPPTFVAAGHSMGARVVVEAMRLAPQRIRAVALLDTGYLPRADGQAGEEEARKRLALLALAQNEGVRAMAHAWSQGMVHPDRRADAALMEAILAMFARKSADTFARQINALLNRPDGSDVLQRITVPTLLLCGRQDSWSPLTQHQAMQALVPHSTLVAIEQAGHMAPMERPVEVAAALNAWLALSPR